MPSPWESKWTVVEQIGVGGQGETFKVKSSRDPDTIGVLKKLKNTKKEQARNRMRREVASLIELESIGARVPKVIDHNTDCTDDNPGQLYVVMEFVDGSTLKDLIAKNGRLPYRVALDIATSLCEIIQTAHSIPVLHRDLKPENVVISSEEPYVVTPVDYGLSFNAIGDDITMIDENFRNRFLDLPETNTPNGDRRDQRSDLTAICGLLYYSLTGIRPGHLIDANDLPPHKRDNCGLPAEEGVADTLAINQLLSRGFATNVRNRFQSATELHDALQACRLGLTESTSHDPKSLATTISARIRAVDKKSIQHDLRARSGELLSFLNSFPDAYRQLGAFKVTAFQQASSAPVPALPAGLERVGNQSVVIGVKHNLHPHLSLVLYTPASREESILVLQLRVQRIGGIPELKLQGGFGGLGGGGLLLTSEKFLEGHTDWRQVAEFETIHSDVRELIKIDFESWLAESLKWLEHCIIGQSQHHA